MTPGLETAQAVRGKAKPSYIIEAVIRSLDVFDAFLSSGEPGLALAQISALTGMNKNAVFRVLYTLVQAGFMEKDDETGRYGLSLKLVELGRLARQGQNLRQLALPIMQELWRRFQETVNLAILRNGQLILVEVLECPHSLRVIETPGLVAPLHATALGKAVLSLMDEGQRRRMLHPGTLKKFTPNTMTEWSKLRRELENTKRRGWSIDDEESTLGARCVAVAVSQKHLPVGAISISGPLSRLRDQKVKEIGEELRRRAASLSLLL